MLRPPRSQARIRPFRYAFSKITFTFALRRFDDGPDVRSCVSPEIEVPMFSTMSISCALPDQLLSPGRPVV
jgi:hypothetical protein